MGILSNGLAVIKLATTTPDATEVKNYVADTHQEAHTEQVALRQDMISQNTHDRVLNVTDFQKSRENNESGPIRPFTPEELAKIAQIKDSLTTLRNAVAFAETPEERQTAQQKLDDYRNSADCQKVIKWHKKAVAYVAAIPTVKRYEAHDDRDYTRETGEATTERDRDRDTKNHFIAREIIKQTRFVEKWEGITSLDSTFAGILANPKYAGKVRAKEKPELSKELAKEIFAGFSPEFQKVFLDMNIRLNVKKYPDKIKVYFIYGTIERDGIMEDAKVKFLDTSKGKNIIYVVDVANYGKSLAQKIDIPSAVVQQLREKNGVIEQVDIMADGSDRPGINAQKNPTPAKSLAIN